MIEEYQPVNFGKYPKCFRRRDATKDALEKENQHETHDYLAHTAWPDPLGL